VHADSSATRSTDRRTYLVALTVAFPLLAMFAGRFDFVCDDAYISFRYSRHLAEGHGLVFNVGESPPVEGYSNFLWVLWLALFELLRIDITVAARASSIAAGFALVVVATRFLQRRLALGPLELAASAAFLACLPTMAVWSTSGLETMPFALSAFLTFERLALEPERPRGWQAGIAGLCCALLRADGPMWASLMIAAALLAQIRAGSSALRACASAFAIVAIGTLAHVVWRHGYYGEWLPNTARIKAGLSSLRIERGLNYAVAFLLTVPALVVAISAAVALRASRMETLVWQALAVVACTFGYAVFIGGDFMPMGRFLIVAMPFVALLFAMVIRALRPHRASALGFALACVALSVLPSFDIHVVPAAVREHFHFRWNDSRVLSEYEMWRGMRERAENWSRLGRALARESRPGESIILGNIGAIGYYTELEILDVFGLTNRAVAMRDAPLVRASPGHDKAVAHDFFDSERPDYWSAFLAPRAAPPSFGLPPGLLESPVGHRITLERRPLDSPADIELRLLRLHWNG
jgi:arabinofuranosyltransferase